MGEGNPWDKTSNDRATLWQRFLAFAIDGLLIGVPLTVVGFMFFPDAVGLGDAGRLIGLGVVSLYFGYFDSSLGEGQSLGKRLLKIQVVASDGRCLSPAKAVLRAWVLYLPILLNGVDPGTDSRVIGMILSVAIFGMLLSLVYLFLANRGTRQSLHDLATNARVMSVGATPQQDQVMWKGHLAAVGLFLVLAASMPWLASFASSRAPAGFSDMVAMKKAAEGVAGVRHVGVSIITALATTGTQPESSIIVTVIADNVPADQAGLTRRIQDAIFPGHEDFVAEKPVLVVVNYGFNFGVATGTRSFDAKTSQALWKASRAG